jgi:hypothetical protein
MRERDNDLCYCKPGFTGQLYNAAKVTPEVWAAGVLAIDALGAGSMSAATPKLSAKNRRVAERIMQRKAKGERG